MSIVNYTDFFYCVCHGNSSFVPLMRDADPHKRSRDEDLPSDEALPIHRSYIGDHDERMARDRLRAIKAVEHNEAHSALYQMPREMLLMLAVWIARNLVFATPSEAQAGEHEAAPPAPAEWKGELMGETTAPTEAKERWGDISSVLHPEVVASIQQNSRREDMYTAFGMGGIREDAAIWVGIFRSVCKRTRACVPKQLVWAASSLSIRKFPSDIEFLRLRRAVKPELDDPYDVGSAWIAALVHGHRICANYIRETYEVGYKSFIHTRTVERANGNLVFDVHGQLEAVYERVEEQWFRLSDDLDTICQGSVEVAREIWDLVLQHHEFHKRSGSHMSPILTIDSMGLSTQCEFLDRILKSAPPLMPAEVFTFFWDKLAEKYPKRFTAHNLYPKVGQLVQAALCVGDRVDLANIVIERCDAHERRHVCYDAMHVWNNAVTRKYGSVMNWIWADHFENFEAIPINYKHRMHNPFSAMSFGIISIDNGTAPDCMKDIWRNGLACQIWGPEYASWTKPEPRFSTPYLLSNLTPRDVIQFMLG